MTTVSALAEVPPEAVAQAEAQLGKLQKTMAHAQAKLGFTPDEPLSAARLGEGIPLFLLNLDAASAGVTSLPELSVDTGAYVFVVRSASGIRCLLFMDRDPAGKGWVQGMFGRANMAKLLRPVIDKWQAGNLRLYLIPGGSEFLFHVTTLPEPNLTALADVKIARDGSAKAEVPVRPLADLLKTLRQ